MNEKEHPPLESVETPRIQGFRFMSKEEALAFVGEFWKNIMDENTLDSFYNGENGFAREVIYNGTKTELEERKPDYKDQKQRITTVLISGENRNIPLEHWKKLQEMGAEGHPPISYEAKTLDEAVSLVREFWLALIDEQLIKDSEAQQKRGLHNGFEDTYTMGGNRTVVIKNRNGSATVIFKGNNNTGTMSAEAWMWLKKRGIQ